MKSETEIRSEIRNGSRNGGQDLRKGQVRSGRLVSPSNGSILARMRNVMYCRPALYAGDLVARKSGAAAVGCLACLLLCDASFAGDQGTEFDDVWNTLLGWAQGTLGKIIALSMMLVGIIAGVARQSIMAFAMGIAAGLGLFYAPGVINGVVSAQLPVAAEHADVIMTQLGQKAGGM